MELIDSVIKFISSYPVWAKVAVFGNAICMAAILVFTPRMAQEVNAAESSKELTLYELRIDRVELFPMSESTIVKIFAYVNGTKYTYPSIGGVEWMEVAPSMSGQTFRLPESDRYEIRFEMLKRSKGSNQEAKFLSQEVISTSEGINQERYSLHGFDASSGTRSGSVSAEVIYSLKPIE